MKYEIGDKIQDNKRDITIVNVRRNDKGKIEYQYICNKCNYDSRLPCYKDGVYQEEYWLDSSHLKAGVGCCCCQGRAVVPGINNIETTHKELALYFSNKEDTLRYTSSSKKKVKVICPKCHHTKQIKIYNLHHQGFSCPYCSDKLPLGEKIMYILLSDLNINFIKEFSSSDQKWTKRYRYDFFIAPNTIIEIMGKQHSNKGFEFLGGRSVEEEQANDKLKKKLALKNGIQNYICIDASISDFEYIKNNILQSSLKDILNFSEVKWQNIKKKTYSSILVQICDFWNQNKNITTGDLSKMFHMGYASIQNYLKIGKSLGICEYDAKKYRKKKISSNDSRNDSKPLVCLDKNIYFKSAYLCSKKVKIYLGYFWIHHILEKLYITNMNTSKDIIFHILLKKNLIKHMKIILFAMEVHLNWIHNN